MIANPKATMPTQQDPPKVPTNGSIGALGNRRLFADRPTTSRHCVCSMNWQTTALM